MPDCIIGVTAVSWTIMKTIAKPKREEWLSHSLAGHQPVFFSLMLFATSICLVCADQIEMQNGDRYLGKVLSLNTNMVILQSDLLGTLNLPREKVAIIALGTAALTNSARPAALASVPVRKLSITGTNAAHDGTSALRWLGGNTNVIRQVEEQFLAGAGPEAKAKFNEMASGLMSGKLTVSDIRVQAKSAADQLRAAKRDLGEEAGFALDGYLAILDSFLRETESTGAPASKTLPSPAKPKAGDREEE